MIMELEIQTQGEHTIILPRGEIDFHSSPRLREQMLSVLDSGRDLLVDMSEVSFIDSSAIASLVEGLQHARNKGRELALASIQETPMKVLQLTRLDSVFPIHESINACLKN
jgi:anti-sigma B factor antagonist